MNFLLCFSLYIGFIAALLFLSDIINSKVCVFRKILGFIIRYFHDFIITFYLLAIIILFYKMIVKKDFDLMLLLIVNIICFILILQFFIFKRCVLTIIYNKILKLPICKPYISIIGIIGNKMFNDMNCSKNFTRWINDNMINISMVLILNIVFLIKSFRKSHIII